jgi:hypothetical protein
MGERSHGKQLHLEVANAAKEQLAKHLSGVVFHSRLVTDPVHPAGAN